MYRRVLRYLDTSMGVGVNMCVGEGEDVGVGMNVEGWIAYKWDYWHSMDIGRQTQTLTTTTKMATATATATVTVTITITP